MRRLPNLPGLLVAAAILAIAVSGEAEAKRKVVVELYTSQGCDSCPPADALLARLADRKDVLALSLPITYWDMLGWKDTLASEGNTRRQKAYAAAMGRGGIYTPQMIIDGTSDVVGSREAQVEAAIAARMADMREIPVTLRTTPDTLHIVIGPGAARSGTDATVWLFYILSRTSVHIAGGENQGRSVTYRNVVRDVRAIAVWKGQALSLDLPRHDLIGPPHDAVAVVLQERGYGRVIGEASLGPPEFGSPP
ncbi:MAG TPA: DUF1223 domain-containing protein [Rhizomicrobium sp.]|jgi:hypothetical protein|nr:DUF1223 domain-containing protein [Rhizomicrobium sp.]